MKLTSEQKTIMRKRKFRRTSKFFFGLLFRFPSYYLIFGKYRDEDGNKVGGRWVPSEKELELKAKIKADKRHTKEVKAAKKAEEKAKLSAEKAKQKALKNPVAQKPVEEPEKPVGGLEDSAEQPTKEETTNEVQETATEPTKEETTNEVQETATKPTKEETTNEVQETATEPTEEVQESKTEEKK